MYDYVSMYFLISEQCLAFSLPLFTKVRAYEGAPWRVEAGTEDEEEVGVIPAGRGQVRTNVQTLL